MRFQRLNRSWTDMISLWRCFLFWGCDMFCVEIVLPLRWYNIDPSLWVPTGNHVGTVGEGSMMWTWEPERLHLALLWAAPPAGEVSLPRGWGQGNTSPAGSLPGTGLPPGSPLRLGPATPHQPGAQRMRGPRRHGILSEWPTEWSILGLGGDETSWNIP